MNTYEGFDSQAQGARELRIQLEKGDISVDVGERWVLQWESAEAPYVERSGDAIIIRQRAGGLGFNALDAGVLKPKMNIRLTVPADVASVELRTGAGKIDANGLQQTISLTTGSGALSLHASRGNITATTGNGRLFIQECEGAVTASTGNGPTEIARFKGNAKLNTGNGRVEVTDCEGRIKAATGNGDVLLNGVAGEAELNTGHGQVEITGSQSLEVHANTAMGSIRIEDGSVRNARLNTMLGEIRCAVAMEPGSHQLSTAMGNITLDLPANSRARVDAQTGFGQVRSDYPLVRVGRSGPMGFGGVRMVGSIGEGEPDTEISMRSGKGQIVIRRVGVAQQPAPQAGNEAQRMWSLLETPRPPAQADPTLAILEAVARGEITPEDADRLLSEAAGA